MMNAVLSNRRAIALIMAVAIMALLAVIGFGFMATAKVESDVASNISMVTHARMAAQAAVQMAPGLLIKDAMRASGTDAGPQADHPSETMFVGTASEIANLGNRRVMVEFSIEDEAGKMNLNAFGNLSRWDYQTHYTDNDAGSINPALNLWHGANQRLSSFEISFEEFFYSMRGTLWPGESDGVARIRSANLARAICLYRHGPDGKPGQAGVDDNNNNALLTQDGWDSNADGTVDGADEGVDEPYEYNPFALAGDDRRFYSIEEVVDALRLPMPATAWNQSSTIPAAVNYDGSMDQAACDTEANRLFALIKDQLTVHSSSVDIRSVSIDDFQSDGYDNDGDGFIDAADDAENRDGQLQVQTLRHLLDEIRAGRSIYDIKLREASITPAAQAAYMYLKLSQPVRTIDTNGAFQGPAPLVPGFTLKNALDIVDYRDTDAIPTHIRVDSDEDAAVLGIVAGRDYYGMEGLHITELGSFILQPTFTVAAAGTGTQWLVSGTDTCTLDWTGTEVEPKQDKRKVRFTVTDTGANQLHNGGYLLKFTVSAPDGGTLTFSDSDSSDPKVFPDEQAGGTFYFGPLRMNAYTGHIEIEASETVGTFSVKVQQFSLPYIEICNWSRVPRDMRNFKIAVGGGHAVTIGGGTSDNIPGHDAGKGFSSTHHLRYGYYVIAYDANAFTSHVSGADYPICGLPAVFNNGFTGAETVTLWTGTGDFVAGGVVDFGAGNSKQATGTLSSVSGTLLTDSSKSWTVHEWLGATVNITGGTGAGQQRLVVAGTTNTLTVLGDWAVLPDATSGYQIWFSKGSGLTLSTSDLAVVRSYIGGDMSYSDLSWAVPTWSVQYSGSAKNRSPGRPNRINHSDSVLLLWPASTTPFVNNTHPQNLVDAVVISDRGYYRSPAELGHLSLPRRWCGTISPLLNFEQGSPQVQPHYTKLLTYTYAGRAPARININTASQAVLDAAFCAIHPTPSVTVPTASQIAGYRNALTPKAFTDVRTMLITQADSTATPAVQPLGNVYLSAATDDDGANDGNDFHEVEEWLIRNFNVFTLRSQVYTVRASGSVLDAAGNILARDAFQVIFDRGQALTDNDTPAAILLKRSRVAP